MSKSRLGWLVVAVLVAAALGACHGADGYRQPVVQANAMSAGTSSTHAAAYTDAEAHTDAEGSSGITHTHADGTTHSHGHAQTTTIDAEPHAHHGVNNNAAASERASYGSEHPESDPNAPCTCANDIYHNTWCRSCNMGFIAGAAVVDGMLFSTIDAHGHVVDLTSFECAACTANIPINGFCEPCSTGFYKNQAYFTRLTHGIAQGTTLDPAKMQCATCKSYYGGIGWCDQCHKGIVGNVAITNRALYETTAKEFTVFLMAIEKARTCELCACAMVMHRICPKCGINYATAASPVQ